MKYEVTRSKPVLKPCAATKFIQDNLEYRGELDLTEWNAYQQILRRDGRTQVPCKVSYHLDRGGWKSAQVDEQLVKFFTNTILPIWNKQQ